MKVSNLHRKQQTEVVKAIRTHRESERVTDSVDIKAQVARARSSFIASRDEFSARAAKAKKSLAKTSHSVMLG